MVQGRRLAGLEPVVSTGFDCTCLYFLVKGTVCEIPPSSGQIETAALIFPSAELASGLQ